MDFSSEEELAHYRLAATITGLEISDFRLPESRQVILGGMRFHYLEWGSKDGLTLLFLHGGGLNAHTWGLVCLALRSEYHCVALDQRGHGESEWSPELDYGAETQARDIERLASHLALSRFVLVGQSMGALNAFTHATLHPGRVAGLVLIDAGPGIRIAGAEKIVDFVRSTACVDSLDAFVSEAMRFNPRRDPRLLRFTAFRNLRRRPDGTFMRKHDVRHLAANDAASLVADARRCWERADQLACPTLIVRGALSDVFLDEDAENFACTLPDARWIRVEGAGHTVQGDNPRGLVEVLRAFLRDLGLQGPSARRSSVRAS
ncbi:MAG: alpha/beta hydrolase [Deltaproteobacteria bacterium]|nr:alpha/beta hydrolase [Deltaproteobacteria bacterium]